MSFLTTKLLRTMILVSLWISLLIPGGLHAQEKHHNILVLHSYHAGLVWTDGLQKGLEQYFANSPVPVHLYVDYMDTKRNPGKEYLQRYSTLLQYKLRNLDFDLILVTDNDAYNLAVQYRDDLFASRPIVFCGVNDFHPEKFTAEQNITGVAEDLSVEETLDVALKLQPNSKELILIGSRLGATDLAINQDIERSLRRYGHGLKITTWRDIPIEKLQKKVATLKPGQLIFLSSVLTRRDGTVLSFRESIKALRCNCPVPIYSFWDFFLGYGLLGGKLISSEAQGREAARLAEKILSGVPINQLPVITGDANVYLFDDVELKRFGISASQLPASSQRINKPAGFYPVAKQDFWLLGVAGGLLLVLIGLLLWNLHIRKIAEQLIYEKEERLRLALDGSQDGFWDWDVSTGSNIVDERWCRMLGYEPDEIEHHIDVWEKLVHPDDMKKTRPVHERCMRGEISHFATEFRMRTKQGGWKWILGRGMVVSRDQQGNPLRLTGTHKDISQQKNTEHALKKALQESEEARNNINAILTSLTDGMIVSNRDHHITMINRAAQKLLDVDEHQAIGQLVETIVDGQVFSDELGSILSQEKTTTTIDVEMMDQSRQEMRVIQARFSAIYDNESIPSGAITLLQDVTRSREMARLKSEFISTAAHELRTPLTAMLGFSDLLLESPDISAEERREYLQIISSKSESLAAIVDDLLDLSRIESGRLITLDQKQIPLQQTLVGLIEQYRDSCPDHQFITHLNDIDSMLYIDENKMAQVIENLLSNAVKYSPEGGNISIETRREPDGFLLTIADQGIGMTPAQVERIFNKFYRVDGTNTAVGGLGLGMSIAKHIVEAHQGEIWVESTINQGTTSYVRLPLSDLS
ncbi:PAS domain-containing protein [Desulfuromonas acetoxidans]|uniref:histidine kinase n=2 Tax=Desulfuromonas acetoxidans TaxID=891 RepID=Q1K445_DESA6|nr:ATP-binding protein [Desulfuromonas acetoxidans]EAT17258.1 PAS/PAC sensor signal transduction histidine kinase [Desulfuromonas acetoxidans DSM 684]NVD24152.1 PAS domain-containing protein [Desulfuromonas acetoxidans]NVE15075.1 PAS domain-containing protein [Desulfuromonas acetoxidans]